MKLLLLFLVHALNGRVFSAKIYPVDETSDSGESDRYQQQQPLTGQLGDMNDQSCPYSTNYSMIIKTNESIADKAVFLEFRKGKTKEDCIQSCCSHTDCTLAVYENKDERNCYLFNCGKGEKSRCHFARHEGYMIMTFQHRQHVQHKSPLTKLKEAQHEDELEGLVDQNDVKTPEKTAKPPTIPPVVTTTTTTQKPVNQDSDAGHLYGECSEGLYCHDENAVCRQGICVCKSGYHATYGMCSIVHIEDSLHQLGSMNYPEGRDGRPPIKQVDTSDTDGSHVDSPQKEEEVKDEEPVIPQSESKTWPEDQSDKDEDNVKQSADTSSMREDYADPGEMMQRPAQHEAVQTEKKEKPTDNDDQKSGSASPPDIRHKDPPEQVEPVPERDEYPKQQPIQQAPIHRPQPEDQRENIQGVQGEPSMTRPQHLSNYPNRNLPQRPHPYPVNHRQGVMRAPGPGRTQGRQPSRQPVRQPVRQPTNSRNRFSYPYNGDTDRGPMPQYPVQYPSYEWDYHSDDYAPSFPDRGEDYNNPGSVDQGAYDYPYRHSYFGPDEQSAPGKQHTGRTKVKQPSVPEIEETNAVEHVKPQEKIPPKPVPTTPPPTHAPTLAPTAAPTQPRVTETPTTTTVIATTTKQAASKTSNSTGTHRADEVVAGHEVAVEQIIIASPTDSAQGPIVALALGLAFTLMLLGFVGCRLRNVKRRIRKGRALHSNEADYLINGMYL